jgi:ubiquinone/menaquinone biosynthesis C-methylase UbiE
VTDWARSYFERGYAQRWGLAPPTDRIHAEAAAFWTWLRLSRGAAVVDIGCGHGRHAVALAEAGADVIGVDAAAALLERAREIAAERGAAVRWIRGDMRRLPLRSGAVDAAVMIDAFGFFDTDEENDAVLREVARVVRSEGRFGMKVVNGSAILASFRETDLQERDGVVVDVCRTLTRHPALMTERIRVRGSRGAGEYERRQRLYGVEELQAAFERAGLSTSEILGSADGAPFDAAGSTVIWMVGRHADAGRRSSNR